jgi:hypothetical protein
MRAFLAGVAACGVVTLCSVARASGSGDPVIVEYVAPSECASSEAFHALLQAQVARNPNPDRGWRFSVMIRHEGDYVGTLKTERGVRELRAPTCDEVTSALALVIAMAEPELPAPPPPEPPPPPPIVRAPPPVLPSAPSIVVPDRAEPDPHAPQWRLGLRAEHWTDGSQQELDGAFATAGVEVPWGFPKMHFEVGAGAIYLSNTGNPQTTGATLGMIDTQACPVDLPLGSTGIDVLACGRIVVGISKGVHTNGDLGFVGWGGGGGRVRWQSPWRFYVEAHFDGLYGSRIEGVPALMDFGGSVGFRI